MSNRAQPLRSFLYVPGNREAWLRKAFGYGADALVLDLEDSVPSAEKAQARIIVRQTLQDLCQATQKLFVRVNGLDGGEAADDLEAVVSSSLYGIFLPKVRSPEDVVEADILLKFFERRAGVPVGTTLIVPLLETARAMREAYQVACASPRIAYMGGGANVGGDTGRAMGSIGTKEGKETLFLRSKILLDVRAAAVPHPRAGVWADIGDIEGLRAYAREMRHLGYTGLTVLHPSQVSVAHEVFTPTQSEIAYWQGLLQTMEEAERAGRAAVTYKGAMVDIAMVKTAKDMLEAARQFGVLP